MSDTVVHAQRTERFDLRALYETSQLLSGSLDLHFVLNSLLLTAMSKLLVTRGIVWLYDPLEQAYRVASVKGFKDIEEGDLTAMSRLDREDLLAEENIPESLAAQGIVLVIPIRFGRREIGLMGLGAKATAQPYDIRELEFIRSLVNMSSTAIHNSLMVEELQQANRDLDNKIQELNTLFDLSQEFNSTLERERLVKLLSFALMGQMLVGKYLFMLRRSGRGGASAGDFEVVASKGLRKAVLEPELVTRLCALEDLLLIQDEVPEEWSGLQERGLVVVMPLRQHGEMCGALCLGPKMTGQPYQPSDIEFLSSLGNLALVSIQNTYLVEEQIEKERLEEEMRLARTIQERLLPQQLPDVPGATVAALALPSRLVGGDYYDVATLEGERFLLAIADVTGKGVPASLLMANLQAALHVLYPLQITLEDATTHINRVICDNTDYDKFITFFWGIYHPSDRLLRYVNAGHNPPMLLRANGQLDLLETGGLLLGVMKGMPYEAGEVRLDPGDVLAVFTDGVTEAMSVAGDTYDEDRLEACLRRHQRGTATEILDAVYADIRSFTGNIEFLSDDLTMAVMKLDDN
jgi:phosphoserine phosphatase RsbU/P